MSRCTNFWEAPHPNVQRRRLGQGVSQCFSQPMCAVSWDPPPPPARMCTLLRCPTCNAPTPNVHNFLEMQTRPNPHPSPLVVWDIEMPPVLSVRNSSICRPLQCATQWHWLAGCGLQICKLVQETIILLLEFNQDAQTLLDWVIDCCYTAPRDIADSCFLALATVFNNRSVRLCPTRLPPPQLQPTMPTAEQLLRRQHHPVTWRHINAIEIVAVQLLLKLFATETI